MKKKKRNPAPAKSKAITLTLKERRFSKEYIKNNGNGTQAVIDAGYKVKNRNMAGVIARQNIKKDKVQKSIRDELKKIGLDESYISSKALKATEAINDTTVQNATLSEGLKALEFVARLHGLMDKNKTITKKSVNVSLKASSREELHKMINTYEEAIGKYKDMSGVKDIEVVK